MDENHDAVLIYTRACLAQKQKLYEQAIADEEIELTPLFTASKDRVVALEDETAEAKAEKKKLKKKKQAGKENKKNDMGDLEAMILAK